MKQRKSQSTATGATTQTATSRFVPTLENDHVRANPGLAVADGDLVS